MDLWCAPTAPTSSTIPPPHRAKFRKCLLRWYDRNRRDLPWRSRAGDPYAQWVAEIMLQQTRVETVVAYYDRFLRRFPDISSLASARHDEVLKHWEGLGYYRRALHMHRAAQALHKSGHDVPVSACRLRKLPGIGEYTAAAIASITGGERVAAVDGNTARVLARLFGIEDDVLSSAGKADVGDLASQLVPLMRPGDFNQAWMDLGSTICTRKSPDCGRCPLQSVCVAAATGRVQSLPVRRSRSGDGIPEVPCLVGILVHEGKVLVRRRPQGGLWSGLWEFPNTELENGRPRVRDLRGVAERFDLTIGERPRRVGSVSHQLTHRLYVFHVYVAPVLLNGCRRRRTSLRWSTIPGLKRLSISTAHRRVFAMAGDETRALSG